MQFTWKAAKDFTEGRDSKIQSILLHSTDGHLGGDLATLTDHHPGSERSVHWYVTRTGDLYHFVQNSDTAYHAGRVCDEKYSNASSVGVETEHIDHQQDWPDIQVHAIAQLICELRNLYGRLPVVSHAAAACPPGRKEDPVDFPWKKLSQYFSQCKPQGLTQK